jgi:hypothetical protein
MSEQDLLPEALEFLRSLQNRTLAEEFVEILKSISAKRARTVIDHIIRYGYVTTLELEDLYGYKHPPRAARDVRELGIPLITYRTQTLTGRNIAVYYFGDPSTIRHDVLHGRKAFPKRLKRDLAETHGNKCAICNTNYEARYLQVDHCVPYEVAGDVDPRHRNLEEYMLLCGSCNRAKSWSCEHCQNWIDKALEICKSCYWANPENYTHIALRAIRRLDLVWVEDEVSIYEKIKAYAAAADESLPDFVKSVLARYVSNRHEQP